jgi:hypothetical protein
MGKPQILQREIELLKMRNKYQNIMILLNDICDLVSCLPRGD